MIQYTCLYIFTSLFVRFEFFYFKISAFWFISYIHYIFLSATALVVMVFLMYLLVACWGCTMVKEGLERRRLSRYDSYSVAFYDLEDMYFREYPYRIQVGTRGFPIQVREEFRSQSIAIKSFIGLALCTRRKFAGSSSGFKGETLSSTQHCTSKGSGKL